MWKNKKEKENNPFSLKKELALAPGYLVLMAWVGFTAVILIWVIAASLSTTGDSAERFLNSAAGCILRTIPGCGWLLMCRFTL